MSAAKTLIAGLILFAATGIAALTLIDLGRFKTTLLAWTSHITGYAIAAESLSIRLGLSVRINATGISIARPMGNPEQTPMLTIKRFALEGKIIRLLAARPTLDTVSIEGLGLQIGKASVQSSTNNHAPPPGPSSTGQSQNPPLATLPLRITTLTLRDAQITYGTPEQDNLYLLKLKSLKQTSTRANMAVSLAGAINDQPLKLDLAATSNDPITMLQNLQITIKGQLDTATIDIESRLNQLRRPSDTQLSLDISGPDTRVLTRLLNQPSGPKMPFSITASASQNDAGWSLANLQLSLAALNLTARASLPELSKGLKTLTSQSQFDAELKTPDLAPLATILGLPDFVNGPLDADLKMSPNGAHAILTGDIKSRFGTLALSVDLQDQHGNNPTVALKFDPANPDAIRSIPGLSRLPDKPLTLAAKIQWQDGAVIFEHAKLSLGNDLAEVTGTLRPNQFPAATALSFDLTAANLRQSLGEFMTHPQDLPTSKLNLRGALNFAQNRWHLHDTLIRGADLNAKIKGSTSADFNDISTVFSVQGKSLLDWVPQRLLHAQLPRSALDEGFSVSTTLQADQARIALTNLSIALAKSSLKGNIESTIDGRDATFNLAARSEDLAVFAAQNELPPGIKKLPLNASISGDFDANGLRITQLLANTGKHLSLDAQGALSYPSALLGASANINLQIPNLSVLNPFTAYSGIRLPAQALLFQSEMIETPTRIISKNIHLQLADSILSGRFEIDKGDVPHVELIMDSELLDLKPLMTAVTSIPTPEPRPMPLGASADLVIPNTPIDLTPLSLLNADVSITIKKAQLINRTLNDVSLSATLAKGRLSVSEALLTDEGQGTFGLSGVLALNQDTPTVSLNVTGQGIRVGFPAQTAEEIQKLPALSGDIAVKSYGNTPREMAANANGYAGLDLGKGEIPSHNTQIFTSDFFNQLFTALNPYRQQKTVMQVTCGAIDLRIKAGEVTGNPAFVLTSKQLNIFAKAKVDLKSESINASFRTVPQKGLGLSLSSVINPFVGIGGSLAKPALTLNTKSTLLTGGAALATGGLSFIASSFAERFLADKDPCGKAQNKARAAASEFVE